MPGKPTKPSAEKAVRDIRRTTRRRYSAEEKIRIVLDYLPSELNAALQQFVDYYIHERYHESLKNLTPADVFYGRGQEMLEQREKIKLVTLAMRRKMHYDNQTGRTPR